MLRHRLPRGLWAPLSLPWYFGLHVCSPALHGGISALQRPPTRHVPSIGSCFCDTMGMSLRPGPGGPVRHGSKSVGVSGRTPDPSSAGPFPEGTCLVGRRSAAVNASPGSWMGLTWARRQGPLAYGDRLTGRDTGCGPGLPACGCATCCRRPATCELSSALDTGFRGGAGWSGTAMEPPLSPWSFLRLDLSSPLEPHLTFRLAEIH